MTSSEQMNILRRASFVAAAIPCLVFAANGTHSTGASAAASAMGGTAVANYTTETEAFFRNPALLGTKTKAVMSPRLELSSAFAKHNSQGAVSNGSATLPAYGASNDKVHPLPNFAASMKLTDALAAGFGIVAVGGSSVDYTGNAALFEQKSEQVLYRLTPAVSFTPVENVQIGAGLVVGYGSAGLNATAGGPQTTNPSRSAWAVGGIFGVAVEPIDHLKFGLTYLTKTKFTYKQLYDLGNLAGVPSGTLNDVTLTEPAEFAAGVAYEMDAFTVALDYRYIAWSQADGYRHLGWSDQNVLGLGVQYLTGALALRAGANYGKSPIRDASGINGDDTVDFQGVTVSKGILDQANILGFTAITEWELDVGVGYQISEQFSADLAFVFCPEKTITHSGTMTLAPATPPADYVVSSKASEWAIVAGVNYQL